MKNIILTLAITAAALAAGFPNDPTPASDRTVTGPILPEVTIRPRLAPAELPTIILPEVTIRPPKEQCRHYTLPEIVIEAPRAGV